MNEIDLYCNLMDEVKKRTAVVQGFLNGQINAFYPAATIESAALQLRKILELIALGSLVAHKEEYTRAIRTSPPIGTPQEFCMISERSTRIFILNRSRRFRVNVPG
jgi:hypothetical protein